MLLSLEGNIGAGKSTFIKILQKNLINIYETIPEPVAEWQNISGKGGNLLELLYSDPKRWAYTF